MKKTYREIMHNTKNGGIGLEAWMFRICGMKLGYFFERQLKKLFKSDI
jgi:hypothetical protein